MTVYLVRHGADDNTKRGGWSNQPLTEEGIKQSEELAEKLKKTDCSAEIIYSSDLLRAKQTAEILSKNLDLAIKYSPEFREVNNGALADMDNDTADKLYPGLYWKKLNWSQHYPDGESPEEFYGRIKDAWSDLVKCGRKSIILVTHGGVINVILHLINGVEYSNRKPAYIVKTADYIEIKA